MIYIGIASVVVGLVCTSISGSLTKKFVCMNNPDAYTYGAAQMKKEWQKVAKKGGVVPSWVSAISIGGWFLILAGIVVIVRKFY